MSSTTTTIRDEFEHEVLEWVKNDKRDVMYQIYRKLLFPKSAVERAEAWRMLDEQIRWYESPS